MDHRKRDIIDHLSRYRLTLKSVIEDHVIQGDASRDLHELRKDGLIVSHERMLSGGQSVYQLTQRAAQNEGLSLSIASIPGPQGLLANLSLTWFCFCEEKSRYRLSDSDQDDLLGGETGKPHLKSLSRYHALETDGNSSIVYRVYVPSARTKLADVERTLYGLIHLARQRPKACRLLDSGLYRIAILIQSEQRAKKLKQFFHRPHRSRSNPIPSLVQFSVVVVPDFLQRSVSTRKDG